MTPRRRASEHRALMREVELRIATVFTGPEFADTVWNAQRFLAVEGIASVTDPRLDRVLGEAIAETLNYLVHQHFNAARRRGRSGCRALPAPIQVA